jgi:pseudouridine synthase
MKLRLQKILSQAGIASRRKAEQLIQDGAVRVNGVLIRELGTKADPLHDTIEVAGLKIPSPQKKVYLMLNKPKGYVTTLRDPEGRPTVIDLINDVTERLYPVGRLDYDTEGLLILTNDGDCAQALQHPRHNVARTYLVKVRGRPPETVLTRLQKGIVIEGEKTGRARIGIHRVLGKNSWLQMSLWEGRNRQIKKMFSAVGYPVMRLLRIGFGPLQLDNNLKTGSYRHLRKDEIKHLMQLTEPSPD